MGVDTQTIGVRDHGHLTGLSDHDHSQYQQTSEKGAPSGYCDLDASSKVPVGRLPTLEIVASDVLQGSDDSEETVTDLSYTKYKQLTLTGVGGELRIKFDLKDTSGAVYGKVYRNGVAVGAEQSMSGDWETKSEDIAGWSDGDTIELWCKYSTAIGQVRNFRVYGSGVHKGFVS